MSADTTISHTRTLQSKLELVTDIWTELSKHLKNMGYSQQDNFAVHLALEEAFANAIKHGNRMDADKKVKIDYTITPQMVEISVSDEGIGFDPEAVPDPRCGENIYRPQGRGLLLIREYMDKAEYNQQGNSITMIKHKTTQTENSPDADKAHNCG